MMLFQTVWLYDDKYSWKIVWKGEFEKKSADGKKACNIIQHALCHWFDQLQ